MSIYACGPGWVLLFGRAEPGDRYVHKYLLYWDDLPKATRLSSLQARAIRDGASPARMLVVRSLDYEELAA
jgi:hypothetical protein